MPMRQKKGLSRPCVADGGSCRMLFSKKSTFSIDTNHFAYYLCNVERENHRHNNNKVNNKKNNFKTLQL